MANYVCYNQVFHDVFVNFILEDLSRLPTTDVLINFSQELYYFSQSFCQKNALKESCRKEYIFYFPLSSRHLSQRFETGALDYADFLPAFSLKGNFSKQSYTILCIECGLPIICQMFVVVIMPSDLANQPVTRIDYAPRPNKGNSKYPLTQLTNQLPALTMHQDLTKATVNTL